MADSNTETATPAAESPVQRGSEFSKPTGDGDQALWEKHFGGKDAKESSRATKETRSSTRSEPKDDKSAKTKDSPASESREKTSKSPASPKERSTGSPRDTATESSTPKDTKSDKGKDKPKSADSEATGQKTAEETDPEAPSKKARDLYEQAKKSEDRREARKLYKRAMVEAFGEVPPEFDDKRYAAVRTERAAKEAAIKAQAEKNEGRIREAAERLKPAIFVMRKLEDAKLADKITVPMVEKALHVMQALKSIEDGDFTQLAEVVSRAAGVDHDEAMKRFVRGTKVSPEGKAARQAAEAAQREAAETKAQLAELQRRLQERESTQTEAQKRAEQQKAQAENRARWLDDIQSDLDGHPVLQLRRGAERVLSYLIRTANKQTKTPRYSFEEAADRIVRAEKERLASSRHLLDEGDSPPARTEPRRLSSVSRSETRDAGVRNPDPEARFSEIFDRHVAGGRGR